MTAPIFILGTLGLAIVALWICALRDCVLTSVFSGRQRNVWFVIILIGPVGGSVAYLTAKQSVEKFSVPDPARLARLLSQGR